MSAFFGVCLLINDLSMPNKKKLYEALKAEGYDNFSDEASFNSYVEDAGNRKKLFDALKAEGYDNFDSEDDFDDYLGYSKPYTHEYDSKGNLVGGTAYDDMKARGLVDDITQGSYQYKPEVQKFILDNKPDMFNPKSISQITAEGVEAKKAERQRPITGFVGGFKQGADALYQGGKNLIGETANLIGGSQRDYERAHSQLDELVSSGYDLSNFDAKKALKDYKDRDFQRKMAEWQSEIANRKEEREDMGFFESLLHKIKDPSRPKSQYEETGMLADEVQLSRAYYAIQDALQKSNGNVEEAKKLLSQEAIKETWGDETTREAREELAKQRPTEGAAAWIGGMIPQMIGTGAGLVASLNPYTRWLSPWLGRANMAFLTGATSGMSMAEARKYAEDTGNPVNEGDLWRTGLVDAAIEYGTEKIPFNRYFGKIQNATKGVIAKTIADVSLDNEAVQNEVSDLLQRASKELGAGIFNKKNITEYIKDVGTEGVSEFMAEALQTLSPIIYQNPEDYPTLKEVIDNGIEGAKGGLFMGAFLGAGSTFAQNRINRQRREKQGYVMLGDTEDGVVEILSRSDDKVSVMNADGEVYDVTPEEITEAQTVAYQDFKDAVSNKTASDMEDAYDEGTDLSTPYDKHGARRAYDRAEAALGKDEAFINEVRAGESNPVAAVNAMAEAGRSDEEIQRAKDYYTALNRMKGMTDALLDNVNSQIESANKEVDANTNEGNGMVTQVVLHDGSFGYVVTGNVAAGEEGIVDVNNSDSYVHVRLANGEIRPMNPHKDFKGVAWTESPETLKNNNNTVLKQKLINQGIGEIDWNPSTPNPKVGDSFEMNGVPVTIVSHDGKGGMFVVPTEDFQAAANSEQKMQELVAKAQQTQPIPATEYKNWASARLDAQEDAQAMSEEAVVKENFTTENDASGNGMEPVVEEVASGEHVSQNELSPTARKIESRLKELMDSGASQSVISSSILQEVNSARKALAKAKKDMEKPIKKSENPSEVMKARRAILERAQKLQDEYSSAFEELGLDENAVPFVKSSENSLDFGIIDEGKGLKSAPIRLSQGYNKVDDKGKNHGYGLEHIEAGHGEQIRNVGFASVEEFVSSVANNYQVIKKGNKRNGENTYLLEVSDGKNNTLFIELAKNGRYWNVNSAGIFREGYSKNKEVVWSLPAVEQSSTAEDSEVQDADSSSKAGNPLSGNSPQTTSSTNKDSEKNVQSQENEQKPFHEREKDDVLRELGEKYGEKMPHKVEVTAKALADDLEKAQKELDKAIEDYDNAPVGREGKAEKAKGKAQKELDEIKVQADFWAALDKEVKDAQARRDAILNPQAEIETSEEPMNADELIAQQLASGNIVLDSESFERETGYGSKEKQALNGGAQKLFKAGGMTIEEAGERLMEIDRENGTNFFDQSDSNAGRDALISFLGSVSSRKEINGYIKNNRQLQQESANEALKNEVEQQIMDEYGMTAEEYVEAQERGEIDNTSEETEEAESTDETVSDEWEDPLGEELDDVPFRVAENESKSRIADVFSEATRIAAQHRKEQVKARAAMWEAAGVKVKVHERISGIHNMAARKAIMDGEIVSGWFDGEVHVYIPHISSLAELDKTIIHEAIAHKGLRELLGEENFDALCDKVWEMMPQFAKDEFINYPGVKGNTRAAADEYMAHLAENENLSPEEKTLWQKIVQWFKDLFTAKVDNKEQAVSILNQSRLTKSDISDLVKLSYSEYLKNSGRAGESSGDSETRLSAKKKRALETASVSRGKHQPTVVSSADGANILNNLDSLAKEYEEKSSRSKTFLGDVANAIGARKQGSGSQYATFETVNGNVVTIRLADHNATVSNFDNRDENEGISIVVSAKDNNGITNDGDAHIVEYFYDSIDLRRADGKPLAEIVKSIKQSLYSGEYKDTTGLAERQEVNGTRFRITKEEQSIIDHAKTDGTYMKAPNGESTNLTEKQWAQVRTKAFKKWFGDWEKEPKNSSKIVDENGEPLVVYHGSEEDFNVFDKTKGRANMDIQGMFFSPWDDDARGYGSNVRAFYLNIKNPANESAGYKTLRRYQGQNGAGIKAREYLVSLGYDGVNNEEQEFIAFESNQIKSATNNNGKFDSSSDDIRFRFIGEKGARSLDKAEVDKFTSKYNSKPVRIVDAEMADEELLESFDNAFELEEIKNFMKESKTAAGYFHNLDKIVIFADRAKVERMEEYLFHENIHAAIHHDNFANLVAYFYEMAKDAPEFERWSKLAHHKEYQKYNSSEEFLAYVVSNAMVARNLDDVTNYLGDKQKKALNKLFNVIGYNYDIRRRSIEQSDNGRTGEETSGKSSLEGDESRGFGKRSGTGERTSESKSGNLSPKERKERLTELFNKVADMGLQGVLGNKEYDSLMMDIYNILPKDALNEVVKDAFMRYENNFVPAVSDYIGAKADGSIMDKIIAIFREALRKVGFNLDLNGNEVKYLAWRSKKPLDRRSVLDMAEDIAKQNELGTNGYTRFRSLEKVNEEFNRQLDEFTIENSDNFIFDLGNPSDKLLAGGVEDKPIRLHGSKVAKKMKKHGFDSWDLKGLPKAVANPIAVFDNLGRFGNRSVLTELTTSQGNFLVTIDLGKGTEVDFDVVSSLFGKNNRGVVNWINNGKVTWVDKEKALNYLHLSAPIAEALDNSELDSATKIVESFENPNTEAGNVRFRIKKVKPTNLSDNRDALIKQYDDFLKTGKFNFIEAFQDRMYSAEVLQDLIVETTGKKVRDYEDFLKAENALSSVNKEQQKKFIDKFYKPLLEVMHKLTEKYGREAIERYVYCKTGLERNVVLRLRDADKDYEDAKAELDDKLSKGEIDQAQHDLLLQQAEDQRNKALSKDVDYSGLRGLLLNYKAVQIWKDYENDKIDEKTYKSKIDQLKANKKVEYKNWKKFAEDQVSAIEGKAEAKELDELWNAINAATQETLRMDYESGMISKETYDSVKNMMKYYVPLRNWTDTTAEEMYEYSDELTRTVSSNQKKAGGRESQADNPIATIALMAQSAIVRGNRNQMKQKFYAFVANRETSLATVRDVWYVKDGNGDWVPQYADTTKANSRAELESIMQNFEANMEALKEQGLAHKGKLPLGMTFKASKRQKMAHVVSVMINGEEHAVYVNGNPRAAQAINGETNSENVDDGYKWIDELKRLYGSGLTSWNPDFIIPNLVRDTIHATTMTMLDKGVWASIKYAWNVPKMFSQVTKEVTGISTGDPKLHAYFEEFVANGGETGYTAIHTLEDYKKEYDKLMNEVKGVKSSFKKGMKMPFEKFAKVIEAANRIAEDVNRFNAYVSARESGESIVRSVDAAKNITVNFNKKGALHANSSFYGKVASFMSRWILFFNPSVQGIHQFMTKTRMNKKRAASLSATILASGFLAPMINEILISAFGGDDEDDYWNQSDYKRRNNWMFFTGDGYISIPLPPVLRELYGMGDIMYGAVTGRIPAGRAGLDMLRQIQSAVGFVNLIPEVSQEPDMVTYAKAFAPDLAAPMLDVISNTDFMGRPIAKWTDFNEYSPEYERVYKGVSPHWVELSKLLNEVGGDEGRRSDFWGNFINPEMMEHLFTSYGGGIGKTLNNLVGMIIDKAEGNDENIDPFRKMPVIPRFYTPNDEKTVVPAINRKFYDYNYQYNVAKNAYRTYRKGVNSKEHPEYQKYLDDMLKNGELEFMKYFESANKRLKKMQAALKNNPSDSELEKRITDLKAEISARSYDILKGK